MTDHESAKQNLLNLLQNISLNEIAGWIATLIENNATLKDKLRKYELTE